MAIITPSKNSAKKFGYGNVDTTINPASKLCLSEMLTDQSDCYRYNFANHVIKGSGNGLLDTVKMSLRNDDAVERNLVKDRTPLAL